jgi:hypothetical protein
MRKSWIALLVMVPCLFAYADENKCKQVSGGILTNFLTESGTVNFPNESGKLFKFATLGTAFILLKLWNSKAAAAEWEHLSLDASLRKTPDLSLATS